MLRQPHEPLTLPWSPVALYFVAAATELVVSFQGPRRFPTFGPEGFSLGTMCSPDVDVTSYIRVFHLSPNVFVLPSPSDSILYLNASQSE